MYDVVISPQALTAELNMHESQSEEYKYENERLAQELQEVKKKYLAQKRKDQEFRWIEELIAMPKGIVVQKSLIEQVHNKSVLKAVSRPYLDSQWYIYKNDLWSWAELSFLVFARIWFIIALQ